MVGGHGHQSSVVAVGHWLWALGVGHCQPSSSVIVIVGHHHNCDRYALVMSTTPSMAEGTASIKPAGGAEKATTARPKAWHMVRQGRVGHFKVARRQDTKGECQHGALFFVFFLN